MKKEWIKLLVISVLMVGCGSDTVSNNTEDSAANSVAQTPPAVQTQVEGTRTEVTPAYKAINNTGVGVEGKLGNYTVKLFANNNEEVKPQERHQGVVVKYDGQTSETMAIQSSYQGKEIVAAIYNGDNLVKVSDSVTVTDVPVVIIDVP